jgi:hypothetical protein
MMGRVILGLAALGLSLTTGCSGFKPGPKPGPTPVGARLDLRQPTPAALVAYLNDNSRQIQSLRAEDVTLDCRQGRDSGVVTGRLDCQRPRNFRLTAKVVGQPTVDIGSNDQEFWYWISRAQPPYVYHCTHDALARGGVRMPFPFQPDMILTAMGLGEYDPQKKYDVKTTANTVELIEQTTSPQGQPVQKVVVFNRTPARGDQPQVIAHVLRDANGRKICEANITHAVRDRATGAELPRRVHLIWPDQQIEMKMKLDDIRVVAADPQLAQSLYTRRNLNSPGYDLARGQPDQPVGEVQRVGGMEP